MTGDFAVALREIIKEDCLGDEIGEEGVVEAVSDPREEAVHLEKDTLLAKLVQLRIPVQEPGRDELIEDAHGEGREDREENVVERQGPRFKDDLTGEGILKRILSKSR